MLSLSLQGDNVELEQVEIDEIFSDIQEICGNAFYESGIDLQILPRMKLAKELGRGSVSPVLSI